MSTNKSLIDAIKDAILTGNSGDISLHERSFLSHLLEKRRGKTFFSKQEETDVSEKWTSFLMTRWILRFFRQIVMGVMWAIHVMWYWIVCKNCEAWKVSKKWLKVIINTKGWKNRWIHIKKVDKQRVCSLLDVPASPTINFLMIAAALIIAIIIIVRSLTFVVKDIMFPPLNMRVNEWGVTTIDQPCMESHSFFLLNASTFWRSTGINVNKGDKVTFSVSGSMYSDIGEMDSAARDNRKLLYDRTHITPGSGNQSTKGVPYCIYNYQSDCYFKRSKNARFGTLLCQVAYEHLKPSNSPGTIFQITSKKNSFTIKKAGTLFLTFNDVLLTCENVKNLLLDTTDDARIMQKDLLDSEFFTFMDTDDISYKTKIQEMINETSKKDSLKKTIDKFYKAANPDTTIWFNDNVGEFLVNIRIERNIWKSSLGFSKKVSMSILREFEHWQRRSFLKSKVPWLLGIALFYFLIDIIVSCMIRTRQRIPDNNSPVNRE